jgi:hypothetical protein
MQPVIWIFQKLLYIKRSSNNVQHYNKVIKFIFQIFNKNKNIRDLYRGITEFKKGYQPKTNLIKDERGDLLADPEKNFD